eukprot:scaffold82166_cov18-Tisochrysis_lutea.AAC.1
MGVVKYSIMSMSGDETNYRKLFVILRAPSNPPCPLKRPPVGQEHVGCKSSHEPQDGMATQCGS